MCNARGVFAANIPFRCLLPLLDLRAVASVLAEANIPIEYGCLARYHLDDWNSVPSRTMCHPLYLGDFVTRSRGMTSIRDLYTHWVRVQHGGVSA